MVEEDPIPVGSMWRERASGRLIRITESSEYNPPHWTYCKPDGTAEPHGVEPSNGHDYKDWYDHRCDVYDFMVWDRFERVS